MLDIYYLWMDTQHYCAVDRSSKYMDHPLSQHVPTTFPGEGGAHVVAGLQSTAFSFEAAF